jgi:hypothetical protein
MDLKSVVTRTPDAAYRIYDGKATIVLPGRAEVKVLNPTGSLVWDRIDGRRPLEEILEAILEEFDIPRQQAEQDLLEFVDDLRNNGMVS